MRSPWGTEVSASVSPADGAELPTGEGLPVRPIQCAVPGRVGFADVKPIPAVHAGTGVDADLQVRTDTGDEDHGSERNGANAGSDGAMPAAQPHPPSGEWTATQRVRCAGRAVDRHSGGEPAQTPGPDAGDQSLLPGRGTGLTLNASAETLEFEREGRWGWRAGLRLISRQTGKQHQRGAHARSEET